VKQHDRTVRTPGIRKTVATVDKYVHRSASFGLSGSVPGPGNIWLFVDADDQNLWNYPTQKGNHGAAGVNVSYCDGHAEWMPQSRFVLSYELSQDENRLGPQN